RPTIPVRVYVPTVPYCKRWSLGLRDEQSIACLALDLMSWLHLHLLFFFFQAEDGIRDGHVTGVQTCALPICPSCSRPAEVTEASTPRASRRWRSRTSAMGDRQMLPVQRKRTSMEASLVTVSPGFRRSEERRVGKRVDLGGRGSIKKKSVDSGR